MTKEAVLKKCYCNASCHNLMDCFVIISRYTAGPEKQILLYSNASIALWDLAQMLFLH